MAPFSIYTDITVEMGAFIARPLTPFENLVVIHLLWNDCSLCNKYTPSEQYEREFQGLYAMMVTVHHTLKLEIKKIISNNS